MRLTSCIKEGGTSLDLSGIPLWEVPTSLVEVPNLVEIRIDQKTTNEGGSRCMFEEDEALINGDVRLLFEALCAAQLARREQYVALGDSEEAALVQALAGSCKATHEDRVKSAVECVLAGETTVLVLNQALETSVPPSLERLGRLSLIHI